MFLPILIIAMCLSQEIQFVMSQFKSVVEPRNALNFFNIVGKLKTLKRTGWVNNGKDV
jgi:hypothetical protein